MNYPTLKVYGSQCALTLERTASETSKFHTVSIEAALKIQDNKEYDWTNKLIVQITRPEMPDVIATLLGLQDTVEFTHHGKQRNKGYRLALQSDGTLLTTLFSGTAGKRAVSLTTADRLEAASMCFQQYQRHHGSLSSDTLLSMIESVYGKPD